MYGFGLHVSGVDMASGSNSESFWGCSTISEGSDTLLLGNHGSKDNIHYRFWPQMPLNNKVVLCTSGNLDEQRWQYQR